MTTVYYKDAVLNLCQTSCGSQQFVSLSLPNICSLCSVACTQCSLNSTYCQKCVAGYFLYSALSECLSTCPQSFYNNPIYNSTLSSHLCSPCASVCRICTDASTNNCTACNNITDSQGVISFYYKQPNTNSCTTTCPVGYLGDQSNNICVKCQSGCVSCTGSIGNCSSCTIYEGVVYYLDKTTNTCGTICPNAGSGNTTDYTCYSCLYFTFKEKCMQSCPSGYVGVIGNMSTCVQCS